MSQVTGVAPTGTARCFCQQLEQFDMLSNHQTCVDSIISVAAQPHLYVVQHQRMLHCYSEAPRHVPVHSYILRDGRYCRQQRKGALCVQSKGQGTCCYIGQCHAVAVARMAAGWVNAVA